MRCVSATVSATLSSGFACAQLAEDDRDDGAAGAGRRAELEPAGDALAFGELVEELLLRGENALRVAVEPLPRLGRLDAAARAVDELHAEPLLECLDLQADGRLRDAEPLGRLREALLLDDGDEGSELPRVHKNRLSTTIGRDSRAPRARRATITTRSLATHHVQTASITASWTTSR